MLSLTSCSQGAQLIHLAGPYLASVASKIIAVVCRIRCWLFHFSRKPFNSADPLVPTGRIWRSRQQPSYLQYRPL